MLWWFAYRAPDAHPALSAEERTLIASGRDTDDLACKPATHQQVLASRSFWAIAIPRFLAEPAWQTFNFFIPLYLATVWKLDLAHIALWAWLPFLAADVGSLAAGLVPPLLMRPNRLFKRGATLLTSRKLTMTLGAMCMIGPACMALAGSPTLAIALFCVGAFAHQMLNGVLVTLCSDLFDTAAVGTATGMAGTIAWTGGMLFTFVIGASADAYGYNPLFIALAALDAVGAIFLWVLLRK